MSDWQTGLPVYCPPFQYGSYSRSKVNKEDSRSPEYWKGIVDGDPITGHAFHLFISRSKARKVMTWIKNPCADGNAYYRGDVKYKVVKVVFRPTDFIAVGHVHSEYKRYWDFNNYPDTICVTRFKFVE